ncbi:hypothetical protein [Bradyrhizobium septentrionale]|uniref:Uncharacterized protein n=1 Tax=Bradyrhizobium septentrionale TaxID=1404411 RepID=A0A974A1X9_9BRAD|nr:hypothetical protein [Bradyrhizobium septentrionale]UGY13907.1 hypothetical protein HAP48_0035870 [Bradyrhizobium septentrionale]UGY22462.1 hypothetical protein HU675_0031365 [Bradyrhizobium septentrionale]
MQLIIGIFCGVLLVGFIVFAFRQGMKVSPDGSGNGTSSDHNSYPGGS